MAYYTVRRDDTLFRIAQRFHVTVPALKSLNGIENAALIYPGQRLVLPESVDPLHPDLNRPVTPASAIGPIRTQLPLSGPGFVTHNPDDPQGSDRYGTEGFVAELKALALAWSATVAVPISFGDMSHRDGTAFPPHRGHRSGREVDIRPFRKDGQRMPVDCRSADYDRLRTMRLLELIRSRQPSAVIYFNDQSLIDAGLCKRLSGHYDHIHLQVYG